MRILKILVFFLFGVSLAALFTVVRRGPSETVQRSAAVAVTPSARFSLSPLSHEEQQLRRNLAVGRGLQTILTALDRGDAQALRVVRGEFLYSVPNYNASLWPAIKQRALENLIQRFSSADWQSWIESPEEDSEAKGYLLIVSHANQELGYFLDTSAILLSYLAKETREGKAFDLETATQNLRAGGIKRNGKPPISPSFYLDPSFLTPFEDERSRLVGKFIRVHPEKKEEQLNLVFSLRPENVGADVSEAVNGLLLDLINEASTPYRLQVLGRDEESRTISELANRDERVRLTLARLYALGAVDALKVRDLDIAHRFLAKSTLLMPGLPTQRLIRNFLRRHGVEELRRYLPVHSAQYSSSVQRAIPQRLNKKEGGEISLSLMIVALIGLIFIGFGIRNLLARLNQQRLLPPEEDLEVAKDEEAQEEPYIEENNKVIPLIAAK